MDPEVREFLLAEFETAFAHIRDIEARRLRFVEFFVSINAILIAAVAVIVTRDGTSISTGGNVLVAFAGAIFVSIIGAALWRIIRSGREADVRYRNKINHIRKLFLDSHRKLFLDSHTDELDGYLDNWEALGTRTNYLPKSDLGSTLEGVRLGGLAMITIWIAGAIGLWVAVVRG